MMEIETEMQIKLSVVFPWWVMDRVSKLMRLNYQLKKIVYVKYTTI